MNNNDIPVWEKYTLTIEEASKYFRIEKQVKTIGREKQGRWLAHYEWQPHTDCKRRQFEKVIDKLDAI